MPLYFMLSTLGPDGAARLIERPERLKEVNREVEQMGVRIINQWALLGQYDFCTILEAENDTQVARIALELSSRGTLKTLTLSAIEVDELLNALRKPD